MMSHQYMVAAAIVTGSVDIAAIRRFSDPDITALAQRVMVVTDEEIEQRGIIGARVTVTLKNGEELTSFQEETEPQTEAGVIARTRVFARPFFPEARVEEILAAAVALPGCGDVDDFMRLLAL
jgi:2-methylcitrate dehydratase PrpD